MLRIAIDEENETLVNSGSGIWEIIRETPAGMRYVTRIEFYTTTEDFSGEQQCAIDAEVLHEVLQIEQSFKKWIRQVIKVRGYFEGSDYVRHKHEGGKRGDYRYNLSLHMARDLAAGLDSDRAVLARFHIQFLQQELLPQRHFHSALGAIFDASRRNEIFEMWEWNKVYLDFDPVKRLEEQISKGLISAEDAALQSKINSRVWNG